MGATAEFLLPDLGEGIDEAEILCWFVEPGQTVKEHQPLVEVQTDKAVAELPCPVSGLLVAHGAPVGGIIRLGGLVAAFEVEGEVAVATVAPMPDRALAAIPEPSGNGAAAPLPPRPLAAPTVRQLARDLGVDLFTVAGSGPGGRVVREDVEQTAAAPTATGSTTTTAVAAVVHAAAPLDGGTAAVVSGDCTRVPLRGLRRTIARKMTETLRTVPHVTGMAEIDVTELARRLEDLRPAAAAEGVRLTWTAFFALATVQALAEFPQLNASLDDDRDEIVLHHHVHLGIATATDDGLLVPVVRHAERRGLLDLAGEIARVSEAARTRSASLGELTGSTFTLTNYGAVGGWYGTPLVNTPEIGIVGFGQVAQRPAVVDGELAVRTMVALSHTVDHRLIDGAVNASFGSAIRRRLEQPDRLFLGVRRGDG